MGVATFGIIHINGVVAKPVAGGDIHAYQTILIHYRRAKLQAEHFRALQHERRSLREEQESIEKGDGRPA